MNRRLLALIVVLVTLPFVQGCGDEPGKNGSSPPDVANVRQPSREDRLAGRVLERMKALVAHDWKKAYEFLPPGKRKILPYDVFANRMGVSAIDRKGAEVKAVACKGDVCEVDVSVTFVYLGGVVEAMQGQQRTSTVHEKWIYADGQWWYAGE